MYCLRCGRDTEDHRVFCDLCQLNMEAYPIKPGTAIHLPHRNTAVAVKKKGRRKKTATPEEQVIQLKRSLRWARALVCLLFLLLILAGSALFYGITHWNDSNIGRNYTIDVTQQTD